MRLASFSEAAIGLYRSCGSAQPAAAAHQLASSSARASGSNRPTRMLVRASINDHGENNGGVVWGWSSGALGWVTWSPGGGDEEREGGRGGASVSRR